MSLVSELLKSAALPSNAIALTVAFFSIYIAYWIAVAIYRLTLHPLSKFPGPFLCRISWIYQIYYEAILNGRMLERLPALHAKYGPVIRINQNEVHINDPEVYHTIYKQQTQFVKDPYAYKLGAPNSLSMTLDPEKHNKHRREILNPSFSKRRVHLLENIMYEEMDKVFEKILPVIENNEPVPIQDAYYCYTGDVISRYLFGKSLNLIELSNFAADRIAQLRSFTSSIWVSIHISLVRNIILSMPRSVANVVASGWMKIVWFCETVAAEAIEDHKVNGGKEKELGEENIFDRMLNDNVKREILGKQSRPIGFHDLADEGASVLVAGTETTATTITFATYYMLLFPEKRRKVLEEIATVERDANGRLPLVKLDALPYLTGVIKETLRYTNGVPGRLTRVVPKGGLFVPAINDYIPEGCVVGISHNLIHTSPKIFEDPLEFKPERWLGQKGKELDHWMLAFSKGARDCIGKNLAYAEAYIVIANILTKFDLELLPGTAKDMEILDRVIVHSRRNLRVKMRLKKMSA
ncbi:hypothetical protein LOZ55_004632 [Ophidiomyces ophidiicola]|nr:hypothetical protein LOZ55_004632 [Ophidiomyces ophidiicola]